MMTNQTGLYIVDYIIYDGAQYFNSRMYSILHEMQHFDLEGNPQYIYQVLPTSSH